MRDEPRYAELHAHSAFTFLEGTDEPADMVAHASRLGLEALAILDVDGMYSTVQTTMAARGCGLPVVYGAEVTLDPLSLRPLLPGASAPGWGLAPGAEEPGIRLPILAASPLGYENLVGMMSTRALERPGDRSPRFTLEDVGNAGADLIVMTGGSRGPLMRALRAGGPAWARRVASALGEAAGGADRLLIEWQAAPGDAPEPGDALAELARRAGARLLATTGARMSSPSKRALGDVLAATRLRSSMEEALAHLGAHRPFLRSPQEMMLLHRDHPQAIAHSLEVAEQAAFDLRLVAPRLPRTRVPRGHTPQTWLAHLAREGARERYGTAAEHPRAWETIERELGVIERLGFAGYFLIVKEIVDFCAQRGILCQGRGSAANSAVCFCLGITAVDAVRHNLLFERFLSDARSGPPDIDVDIEACRREEVIQHVYDLYGRDRAAQVANVITYRPRSAMRDAARALGYPAGSAQAWARGTGEAPDLVGEAARALARLPRHMGIHSGGMVLTEQPVSRICPVGWAAMEGRTVLQWDKEDCADAGLVKFDLLSLGMLTALRIAFDELGRGGARGEHHPPLRGWAARPLPGAGGRPLGLHTLPQEDPRVYDLLCAADTVGVFQVESRAQMNTLPRLRPRCFYDIVVEVALVRPGPIQGRAVNPYLRRRAGREEVTYLHPLLEPALRQTLGVPLFQEQLMRIATDAAGLSASQGDQLRRAMGAKRSPERMEALKGDLMAGMRERGIDAATRERIFDQLKGFADFGFPESHAFSFAHIVYASAWLKVHAPEHFYAAILASQPMGFYSPATLVQDARRHGVRVLGPCVNESFLDAGVQRVPEGGGGQDYREGRPDALPSRQVVPLDVEESVAVRIGLSSVRGLGRAAERIVRAREAGSFTSQADLAERAHLSARDMERLALAGALECVGVGRREGAWAAGALAAPSTRRGQWQPFLPGTEVGVSAPSLPTLTPSAKMRSDMRAMGLTPGEHPFSYVRRSLPTGVLRAAELAAHLDGRIVDVAGIVTHRQRPHTGGGVTFLSLEDETGFVNVSASVGTWTKFRRVGLESGALLVRGTLEWGDGAVNVRAFRFTPLALPVEVRSRDFR